MRSQKRFILRSPNRTKICTGVLNVNDYPFEASGVFVQPSILVFQMSTLPMRFNKCDGRHDGFSYLFTGKVVMAQMFQVGLTSSCKAFEWLSEGIYRNTEFSDKC
jgi:hypothetical protein